MKVVFRAVSVFFAGAIFLSIFMLFIFSFPVDTKSASELQLGATDQNSTPAAYPEPRTPTLISNTPLPEITETPYPTSTAFPTTFPTSESPIQGDKVIYAELRPEQVNIWSVNIIQPEQRSILFSIKGSLQGGIRTSLSPDRTKIAYTIFPPEANTNDPFQAEVWIADLREGNQYKLASLVDIGRYRDYPVWSPDSQQITIMKREIFNDYYIEKITLIDIYSFQEVDIIENRISNLQEAAQQALFIIDWSNDGATLYYQKGISEKVELWEININNRETRRINTITEKGTARCYQLSPNKTTLACTIVEVSDRQQFASSIAVLRILGEPQVIQGINLTSDPIWTSNSSSIAVGSESNILLFSREDLTSKAYEIQGTALVEPIDWSNKGDWLAIYKSPETRGGLALVNLETLTEVSISNTDGSEFIGWIP